MRNQEKNCEGGTIVKKALEFIMVLSFVVLAAGQASGQDLIVYPAKGQSQKQMEKDKFDCYSWAKQQSGFDPMQTPPPAPAPPTHRRRDLRPGVSSGAGQEVRRLARPSGESQAAGAGPERERPLAPSPAAFSAG